MYFVTITICSLLKRHIFCRHADSISGLPKNTWRSLLGAALLSYHELLLVNVGKESELSFFLSLAKRHSTCPQVLSAVAEYLDSLHG